MKSFVRAALAALLVASLAACSLASSPDESADVGVTNGTPFNSNN